MMKKLIFVCLLATAFSINAHSQDIESTKVSYYYNSLPLQQSVSAYKNYQVVVDATYKKRQVQQINGELERVKQYVENLNANRTAAYQQQLKNQQNGNNTVYASFSNSPAMMINGNWVKQEVLKPRMMDYEEATPAKPYDIDLLSSYIELKGYKNRKANALKVIVTIEPFTQTVPTIFSQTVDDFEWGDNGRAYTYQTTRHRAELDYALPMRIQIITPDGREVLNFKPAILSEKKSISGSWTTYRYAMADYDLPKAAEEKALQDNLTYINNLLSNGLQNTKHTAILYHLSGSPYNDINNAYTEAATGLTLLQQENASAKAKLNKAAATWSAALLNADGKQTLSPQVGIALCFNLVEANFALGNFDKTEALLNKLDTYPLSADELKAKKELDKLCTTTRVLRQAVQ